MADDVVRVALKNGMLAQARVAAAENRYDEAFEDIMAVLALEPDDVEANVALVKTAFSFFQGILRNRHSRGEVYAPLLAEGRGRAFDSAKQSILEDFNDSGELIGYPSVRISSLLYLNAKEQRSLLTLSRYARKRNASPIEVGPVMVSMVEKVKEAGVFARRSRSG